MFTLPAAAPSPIETPSSCVALQGDVPAGMRIGDSGTAGGASTYWCAGASGSQGIDGFALVALAT